MIVIGLTGKAGAGKSTVADYLVENHGFTKLSFAGPLKNMLRTLDPVLGQDARYSAEPVRLSRLEAFARSENEIKASVFGAEYRRLLQVLGTDCIRAVDEDFWVRAAMKQLTNGRGKYVFDDVRFPNEGQAIKDMPARFNTTSLWYIKRPNHDAGAGAHESEEYAGRMGETLTITNYSSDIEELHKQVDHLVRVYEFGAAA